MKDWLKKAENKIIMEILKAPASIEVFSKVPDVIDLQVRINLKNISEEIKSK